MKKLTRFLIIFTFVLMGCAPQRTPQPPAKSTPVPVQPTLSPKLTPTLPPSGTQASNAKLSYGLLLVRHDERKNLSFLSVIDPANGYELTGREPISLGQGHYEKLSPDRKTLAVITHKTSKQPYDGDLLFINLEDWSTRSVDLNLHQWAIRLDYSPDSRLVAIADADADSRIIIVDVQQGKILTEKKVGLPIRQLKFNLDGTALMVYGVPGDPSNQLTSGDPQVGLLKLDDLSWHWNAALAGIRDGVYRREGKTGDLYAPGNAFFFVPGKAFAPAADVLYVVNPEKDELTRVDFAAQTVNTQAIHAEFSLLEQLLNLTVTTAHAKGMDSNEKTVLVSPDGQFLYIAGVKNEYTLKDNDLEFKQVLLGLQTVRAADAVLTGNFETETYNMALSADGRVIYLHSWDDVQASTEIFDIASNKIIDKISGFSLTPTQRLDGSPVLVSMDIKPYEKAKLAVFDPNSTMPSATWLMSGFVEWLVLP